MLVCPACQGELIHSATERGYFWTCPACNGRVIGLAALRKEAGDDFAQRVALESCRAVGGLGRPCPMCSNYLMKTTMGAGTEAYDLEICPACQSVWVSAAAYRRLPMAAPPAPPPRPRRRPPRRFPPPHLLCRPGQSRHPRPARRLHRQSPSRRQTPRPGRRPVTRRGGPTASSSPRNSRNESRPCMRRRWPTR